MQEPLASSNPSSSAADELQLTALASARASTAVAGWAVGGVVLMFVEAIVRLGQRALETALAGLSLREWTCFALLGVAFAYGEG